MSISVAILLYIGIIDGMDHLPVLFNAEKAIQKEFAFSWLRNKCDVVKRIWKDLFPLAAGLIFGLSFPLMNYLHFCLVNIGLPFEWMYTV